MAALCFWPWQGWGSVWGEGRARIPALPLPGSAAEPRPTPHLGNQAPVLRPIRLQQQGMGMGALISMPSSWIWTVLAPGPPGGARLLWAAPTARGRREGAQGRAEAGAGLAAAGWLLTCTSCTSLTSSCRQGGRAET
jgi:hypothetical protein